jgi:predicted porin
MFKKKLVALAALACTGSAFAQSNVTISGVLDVGVQHNTNVGGGTLDRVETRHEPSHLTFSGTEDLGGGMFARFVLGMSVALDTGNNTGGFNRESYVALGSNQWGALQLGRQYDTIVDLVGVDAPRFNSVTAVHLGNWDRTAGAYVNNVVKYRTPNLGGFTGTLMYSPKEDGTSNTNSGASAGAAGTYVSGPLRLSAAYLRLDGGTHRPLNDTGRANLFGATFATTAATVVTDDRIAGLGAYYDFPGWRALGEFTRTKLTAPTGRSESLRTVALGVVKDPNTIGFRPGVGVNYSSMSGSHWTTFYGILDYYLSKRTDVYLRVVSQRATGGPTNQRAALFLESASSDRKQTVIGAGITHRF